MFASGRFCRSMHLLLLLVFIFQPFGGVSAAPAPVGHHTPPAGPRPGIVTQPECSDPAALLLDLQTTRPTATGPISRIRVTPGTPQVLRHDDAALAIPAGAVTRSTTLSIATLHDDLPPLDAGMTNLTGGPRQGYRLLPHGRFAKQLLVALPYDPALLPPGTTAQDIRTFYFDTEAGQWLPLGRVGVDTATGTVISCTDHFTDLINGTVTVPDAPETVSFNPNQLNDIKAADPGAGISLIEPPQANAQGDARLSFPIEVPPGRLGVQPSLALSYSSGGENGWLGLGWSLALPAIGVDTRWGVPRYDRALETETYLLDGQQLTPLVHRTALQPRSAERIFHTRVEGSFLKIVRHGSTPANYWWEVRDKHGTTFSYGGDAQGGRATDAVLADPHGNGFQWLLRELRDTHGNTVRYSYTQVSDPGAQLSSQPGTMRYPASISYTGFNGQPGPYQITFVRDRQLGEPARPDAIISGRGGFKQVVADLLRRIDVSYGTQLVRRYVLSYRRGQFDKTLLAAIGQYGADGTLFHTHRFDYYDDVAAANGLFSGTTTTWATGDDNIPTTPLLGGGSALGADATESIGGHLYVGINLFLLPTKQLSVGVKGGYSASESSGLIAQTDLNGDGLLDKVFRRDGAIWLRPNLSVAGQPAAFGAPQRVANLSAISAGDSRMLSGGAELYVVASIGFNIAKTVNTTAVYLLDINSDGLPDVVQNGQVLFNHRNPDGSISFDGNSSTTPYPIAGGAVDTARLLEETAALEAEFEAAAPLLDTLRRWTAPYDGVVRISGAVALQASPPGVPAPGSGPLDGVRVAIQHTATELWATTIPAGSSAPHTPSGVAALSVHKGDQLYFRVQSLRDGRADAVLWDPQIVYALPARPDANGRDQTRYSAASDFLLGGFPGAAATLPFTGTVRLSGTLRKPAITSDHLTVRVLHNGAPLASQLLATRYRWRASWPLA